jgi:hypothetical protein
VNVRWSDALDRALIAMFHADMADADIVAAIPNATVHAIELRRSHLGLQRAMGPTRQRLDGGPGLAEFERRLDAAACASGVPCARLFQQQSEKDLRDLARAGRATAAADALARQKTPVLEVAGLPAAT